MSEVRFINVPAFPEVSVKNLYHKMIKMEGMSQYFPDKYPKGRQCPREYMFSVWNTKTSDVVMEIVKHKNWVQYGTENEHVKEEFIVMTQK